MKKDIKQNVIKCVFSRPPKNFQEGTYEILRNSNKEQQQLINELRLRLSKYETPILHTKLWGIINIY